LYADAHWCRQCKSLEPEFNQVAALLQETNIRLAKVDGMVETALVEKFQVHAWAYENFFRLLCPCIWPSRVANGIYTLHINLTNQIGPMLSALMAYAAAAASLPSTATNHVTLLTHRGSCSAVQSVVGSTQRYITLQLNSILWRYIIAQANKG